ncbi:MAG: hypothetical protein IAE78_00120 [Myxococcus sp.]|nr:hypothetical protein [Myxococcus sp.]
MKTTRTLTLLLKPGLDERVKLSLTGTVLETSLEARRSLLGLTSLWVRPEPLRVALCADERGSWAWADGWTDALNDVVGGYEVRFIVHGGGRGRR